MLALRWVSFALAGVGLALFLAAAVLTIAPPSPDCPGPGRIECQQEAYDEHVGLVVRLGGAGALGMLAAVVVYVIHLGRRKRPVQQPTSRVPRPIPASKPVSPAPQGGAARPHIRFGKSRQSDAKR